MKQKLLFKYYQILAKLAKKYLKKHQAYVIGIHGSVGKTTCRLIISQTLEHFLPNKIIYTSPKNFNGELGMSLSIFEIESISPNPISFLKTLCIALSKTLFGKKPYDVVVLEYGIDRPGEMEFLLDIVKPNMGVITKLDAVHSMQFGSPEAIAQEEIKMLKNTTEFVFLNMEEEYGLELQPDLEVDSLVYQTHHNNHQADISAKEKKLSRINGRIQVDVDISVKDKKFQVVTNIMSYPHYGYIGVALTAADILYYQFYNEEISTQNTISIDYQLMASRFAFFEGVDDTIILDSTYNSAPLSAKKVIDSAYELHSKLFKDREFWLFLGEFRELGDESKREHEVFAEYISKINPDKLFLVGEDMKTYFLPKLGETSFDQKKVFHDFKSTNLGQKIKSMIHHQDKKVFLVGKGSQNTIFIEEGIKPLLVKTSDEKLLCRQSSDRLKKKQKFFND